MYNTLTYATINLTNLNLIDFSQIAENSIFTIRKSVDDMQFLIKWEKDHIPNFITDGSIVPIETYDHQAIIELMATPEWSEPIPL